MSKVKYVVAVLALTALSLAAILINPTNTLQSIKQDNVNRDVRHLMYPGYTGKVLVYYTPTSHVAGDLLRIAGFGFDGVVVEPRYAREVMQDAKGLPVLALGPSDPALHVTVPARDTCGASYWKSLSHTRHTVLNSSVAAVEVDSWSEAGIGVDNCSSLTAAVKDSSLEFSAGKAPTPSIDHFEVYISQDGKHFMKLVDLSAGATALNLSRFDLVPGVYRLVVKEVGLPLYRNYVSNEVVYTR